jgi:hypothetical protein
VVESKPSELESLPDNEISVEIQYLELLAENALLHADPQPEQLLDLPINFLHEAVDEELEISLLRLQFAPPELRLLHHAEHLGQMGLGGGHLLVGELVLRFVLHEEGERERGGLTPAHVHGGHQFFLHVEVLAYRSLDMFDEALTEMFWNPGRTFPRGFIFVFYSGIAANSIPLEVKIKDNIENKIKQKEVK